MILIDRHMTVHAHIQRGHIGLFAIHGIAMAEQAGHLVETGVYMVGEEDGLLGLVGVWAAERDTCFGDPVAECEEEGEGYQGDIEFVTIDGNGGRRSKVVLFFYESPEV